MVSVAALGLFQQVITQCVPYLCCSCSREAPRLVAHLLNAAVWCGAVRCGAGLTVWCRVGGVVSAGPGRGRGVAHGTLSSGCERAANPSTLFHPGNTAMAGGAHCSPPHPTQKHKTIAWRRRNTPSIVASLVSEFQMVASGILGTPVAFISTKTSELMVETLPDAAGTPVSTGGQVSRWAKCLPKIFTAE
ncbi:hypothetical protein E2C01_012622 [Portunus trituberculatus]|uniref:Uncharacterized protein n=1 Tax=Portunus trituberculatus TaxID=210409 RepID=A0A5B7DF36_PORTR|nr:hypothetical protein [Portunus trituberculatus]